MTNPEEKNLSKKNEGTLENSNDSITNNNTQINQVLNLFHQLENTLSENGAEISEKTISEIIEVADKRDERKHTTHRFDGKKDVVVILSVLIFLVSVLLIFQDNNEILKMFATAAIGFIGGGGIGFGLGKRDKK